MVVRNPWESEDIKSLVSVGTHKLHVSTSGACRRAGDPAIIFFSGGGAPATIYQRLQRLLSEEHRVYFHDRAGYNHSERGPAKTLTAQDAAGELATLLNQISVGPPYVLVGHSFGGIVARAFLAQQPIGNIAGIVLVDTVTELMFELFDKIPPAALDAIAAGIDVEELTNLRKESKLTDDQWQEATEAVERTIPATRDEDTRGSAVTLAHKKQFDKEVLRDRPVSVISYDMGKTFRLMYEEGIRRNQGTREERKAVAAFLDKVDLFENELKSSQLRLSTRSRFVRHSDLGHDGILRQPERIVAEVNWVVEQQRMFQHH